MDEAGTATHETWTDRAIRSTLTVSLALLPLIWLPATAAGGDPLPFSYLYPKALWLRVASLVVLLLLAGKLVRRRRLSLHPDRLDWLLLAFAGLMVISTVFSLDRRTALFGSQLSLEGLITYVNYIFLFFVARAYANWSWADQLAKAFLLSTGLLSLLVLLQIKAGFWPGPTIPGRLTMAASGSGVILAGFLALILPLLAAAFFSGRYRGWWAYGAVLLLPPSIAALRLTQGTIVTGIAAISLIGLVVWHVRLRLTRIPWAYVIVVGALAAAILVVPVIGDTEGEVVAGRAPSHKIAWADRQKIWSQTLKIVPMYTATGAGLDNYMMAMANSRPRLVRILPATKPFNHFLEILVGSGALALIVFLLFWGLWLVYVLKGVTRRKREEQAIMAGLAGSIISYLAFTGFFFSTISAGPIFFALAGLGAGLARPIK